MATIFTEQKRKNAFNIKIWIMEARPQYLLLPVVLVLLGTAVAWYEGPISITHAILALIGVLLCHISVNVLNDYFDYKSGIDLKTPKTPFSGGSGILPSNKLTPRQVLWYGMICFVLAVPIAVYFIVTTGWLLMPIIVLGVVCVLLYTPVILRFQFPEWSPGLGLGALPVLGAYFIQTGHYSWPAVIAAIPPGFLVLNLLLLNEFPDAEADKTASRKTLPVTMGKKGAAIIYSSFMILTYVWIIGGIATGQMPVYSLIALLTLPFAVKAIRGSFGYYKKSDLGRILPAMANNVIVVLATQALVAIGFIVATIAA